MLASALKVILCILLVVLVVMLAVLLASPRVRSAAGGAKDKCSPIQLLHVTFAGEKQLMEVLKDGYLRPGMLPPDDPWRTDYVFTTVATKPGESPYARQGTTLFLDPSLLQLEEFHVNLGGWSGQVKETTDTYNGAKLSMEEICRTLSPLRLVPYLRQEVFVKTAIPLHKYLRQVSVNDPKKYRNAAKYITESYPGVKFGKMVADCDVNYSFYPEECDKQLALLKKRRASPLRGEPVLARSVHLGP